MGLEVIIVVGLCMGVCFALVLIITSQLIERGADANNEIVRQRREIGLVRNLIFKQRLHTHTTDSASSDRPRYDTSLERLIEHGQLNQAEEHAREHLALAHDSNDEHRDGLYRDYLARIEKLRNG